MVCFTSHNKPNFSTFSSDDNNDDNDHNYDHDNEDDNQIEERSSLLLRNLSSCEKKARKKKFRLERDSNP